MLITAANAAANPFVLMLDPDLVLQRVAQSQPLGGLARRVCRPLDKPMLAAAGDDESPELSDVDFDADAGEASDPA